MRPLLGPLIAACAIALAPALAEPLAAGSSAAGEVEILTGADSMTVTVDLKPLEPLSPGMRAILAFYAMLANGGCPPADEAGKSDELRCPLTTALGLGAQCSQAQLALVKAWFKDGIPAVAMSPSQAAEVNRSGDLRRACNDTPYTATHQSIWGSLRVRRAAKGLVTVTSDGSWTAGPEAASGFFHDVTTYRILPDRVQVVRRRGKRGTF